MARVRDLLEQKGTEVWTIGPEASTLQAAVAMHDHRIGSLVVTDAGRVIGMITERDILHHVVVEQRDAAETPVEEVMTPEVICCTPDTSVDEARGAMKNRRIRHLPVADADGGDLLGLISIGDLNAYEHAAQEQTLFMLNEYIYGRV